MNQCLFKKTKYALYVYSDALQECAAAYNFNMNDENMWERYV